MHGAARGPGAPTVARRRLFVDRPGAAPIGVPGNRRRLAKQLPIGSALALTAVARASGYRSLRRINAAFAPTRRLGWLPPCDSPDLLALRRTRALPGVARVDGHPGACGRRASMALLMPPG